jgi:hypothetical protein
MHSLLAKVFPKGRKSYALPLSVHPDNCRVHSSTASNNFHENSLAPVPHPPYSADLAPSDFWLFGHVKMFFAGRVFNDADELLETVIEFLNDIHPSELRPVFTIRSQPTMETIITSKQHSLNSRSKILSGWPRPRFLNHYILLGMNGISSLLCTF